MLIHFQEPTRFQSGDEIVLFRDRECPAIAFFRGSAQMQYAAAHAHPSTRMDASFLAMDALDPGSAACRSLGCLLEALTGMSLRRLSETDVESRYRNALGHPCAAWSVQ